MSEARSFVRLSVLQLTLMFDTFDTLQSRKPRVGKSTFWKPSNEAEKLQSHEIKKKKKDDHLDIEQTLAVLQSLS